MTRPSNLIRREFSSPMANSKSQPVSETTLKNDLFITDLAYWKGEIRFPQVHLSECSPRREGEDTAIHAVLYPVIPRTI